MEKIRTIIIATAALFITMDMAFAQIEKISVSQVNAATKAAGFKTFGGKLLRTRDLQITNHKIIQAQKVIKTDFIEMKDGEIYYPEEIEFVYSVKDGVVPSKFKAPKEEEKAPQDSDSN